MTRITWNIVHVMPFRTVALATLLSFMAFTPVAAQGFNDGVDAYENGNFTKALRDFLPLAENGHVKAQALIGIMYSLGQGVTVDEVEAFKWYQKAALNGNTTAQAKIGFRFFSGIGTQVDYSEAWKWSLLAASQGEVESFTTIGAMYQTGRGAIQDYKLAHMWFNLASAEGNQIGAQFRDALASRMTFEDISKAQALAVQCRSSGYTKCGY